MNRACLVFAATILGSSLAAAQSGPVRISGGVMAGQNRTKVPPTYPADARAAHVSGIMVLHAMIGKDGAVENLMVISGPDMLRASALDAVRQWTYKPYLLNGEPTEVDTTVTVNYNLGGEAPPPAPESTDPMLPKVVVTDPSPAPIGPVKISGRVMAAQFIKQVPPTYAGGAQGAVVLRAIIGKDGAVKNLQMMSGPPMFQAAAVDAARQWKYKPYLLNGEAVEVDTTVTVNFSH